MELKLYRCAHCGNIAFKVVDKGVPMVCCGEKMGELVANTTDGALEKHVPVMETKDGVTTIKVGSVTHPMLPEHYIQFIAAAGDDTLSFKFLKPGEAPEYALHAEGGVKAYEYCNLHGYWTSK
ncbi:desulfoferrodoxin family protein [Papillibacter cinnamivorans]|uniref:Desulfoferrodoxin n=1 Tax=Papillibacter cinnamivorans DSM 12816 TaxID=1122930 RepID=A0A1W2BX14_9FIRM|nr:desulfoferrodoxin family protein [Papillibacter cinnamivorans]SMC77459.1 superoxide reductase [Papillibacter cinnamivorans DSM 12816]